MTKAVKLKLLLFICLVGVAVKAISQVKVSLKVDAQILRLDSAVLIPISITNNEDTSILVPQYPHMADELSMGQSEIGMKLFLKGTRKEQKFQISRCSFFEGSFVPIKPKETKIITLRIPSQFFYKKETYDVILYLLLSGKMVRGNHIHKVPSNKFKLAII